MARSDTSPRMVRVQQMLDAEFSGLVVEMHTDNDRRPGYYFTGPPVAAIAVSEGNHSKQHRHVLARCSLADSLDSWRAAATYYREQNTIALRRVELAAEHETHTEPVAQCPGCEAAAASALAAEFLADHYVERMLDKVAEVERDLRTAANDIERAVRDYRDREPHMPRKYTDGRATDLIVRVQQILIEGLNNMHPHYLTPEASRVERAAVAFRAAHGIPESAE